MAAASQFTRPSTKSSRRKKTSNKLSCRKFGHFIQKEINLSSTATVRFQTAFGVKVLIRAAAFQTEQDRFELTFPHVSWTPPVSGWNPELRVHVNQLEEIWSENAVGASRSGWFCLDESVKLMNQKRS